MSAVPTGTLASGLIVLSAALATRLRFPSYHDEKFYLPLAQAFSRGVTLDLLKTFGGMPSAVGPMMFGLYGAWFRVWGPGLPAARCLSVLLAIGALAALGGIGRRLGLGRPVLLGLSLVALPHFFTSSVTFLSEPLTLAAALAGTGFWLQGVEERRRRDFALSALLLAITVNVRVPMLFLPIALALGGGWWVRRWEAALPPLLAILAQVPFWVLWHGPFPPTQAAGLVAGIETRPGLHPETVLHLLTVVGFSFWPALRRCRIGPALLWMLVGVAAYAVFTPDLSFRFAGPLTRLGNVRGGLFRPLIVLAFGAGWALLGQLLTALGDHSKSAVARTLTLAGILGAGIYLASPLASERYALSFSPFWLLSLYPILAGRPRLWGGWVLILLGVAVVGLVVVVR